jgi:hypothetical protein
MIRSSVWTALTAALLAAMPGVAGAQFTPSSPPGSPPSTVQNRWPDPPKPPQAQPAPAASSPSPAARQPAQARTTPAAQKPAPQRAAPTPAAVACSGLFAKDSSHLKLARKYDSRNVVFGQVDGPDGAKLPASILFPNDPKRRLEVLWSNDESRSGTQVIAINGKSQWGAPKGLKLGLSIAALEKLNGRAFKISGFGPDHTATVLGWENGALGSPPGGCKIGMRLTEDAKAPQQALDTVGGDKELVSSDANVRAVKPVVTEILIGY